MDRRPRWLTARKYSPYRAWLNVDLLILVRLLALLTRVLLLLILRCCCCCCCCYGSARCSHLQPSNPVAAVLRPRDVTAGYSSRSAHGHTIADALWTLRPVCCRYASRFAWATFFFCSSPRFLLVEFPVTKLIVVVPKKCLTGRFFDRSFSTDTLSIRAGFVLLHAAYPNVEYTHVYRYALLKSTPYSKRQKPQGNMFIRTF